MHSHMVTRPALDTLTESEAAAVRSLVERFGHKEAARRLGLLSVVTLFKAMARVHVHTLTTSTVRARLAEVR